MKAFRIILTVGLIFGLAAGAAAFDGDGSGMPGRFHGRGAGDGTGPIHDLLSGEPVTISGTVSSIFPCGDAIQITNEDGETFTICGIGPAFYWEELGITRPAVEDTITVNGAVITFSDGSTKTVAISIAIGDQLVQLRDPETGLPLWRRNPDNGQGRMKHDFRKGFRHQDCPAAADSEESL